MNKIQTSQSASLVSKMMKRLANPMDDTSISEPIAESSEGAELKAIKEAITQFRVHLNSSKFHQDPTIQVADVHRYLDHILKAGAEASNSTL